MIIKKPKILYNIPKIIHYCWISDNPYPEKNLYCINTWKKLLPDYKFIKWNYDNFPRGLCKYVDDAFDRKKYAFCADVIRLYALYNYGGIYLDTDVEVIKPLDDLLDLPYFIGEEDTNSQIEAAVIGCAKNWNLANILYKNYLDKKFNLNDDYKNFILPYIIKNQILYNYKLKFINNKTEFDYSKNVICILPVDYFSANNYKTHLINKTQNTYTIHHFTKSWA